MRIFHFGYQSYYLNLMKGSDTDKAKRRLPLPFGKAIHEALPIFFSLAIDTTAVNRFNCSVMNNEEIAPEETIQSEDGRRRRIYIEEEDVSVTVLGMSEGYYDCVRVNSEWLERGFLEGDIILFGEGEPEDGDIVLIEEDGDTRLGVASAPGYLMTRQGIRPLDPTEKIIGVGRGLVRRLRTPEQ